MNKRFPYAKTFIVGFGFLGISIIWPLFNNFVPLFLQAGNPEFERQLLEAGKEIPQIFGFGLTPGVAFFVMTWDNIINVFVQPWAGSRSDRTWNRFGRRKPWIMVGVPIAAFMFIFIPYARTVLAIMVFILITNFGMAIFRSPTVSWLGDIFSPHDRSKANGIINLMGGIGGAIAVFGGGMLFDRIGREAPFLAGSILLVVTALIVLRFVREPERIEATDIPKSGGVLDNLRNVWNSHNRSGFYVLLGILFWFMAYEAISTGLSSFAVFTLGMTGGQASIYTTLFAASFILFALPSGLLATRISRKRTINIGLIGLIILFGAGYFIIRNTITFAIVLVFSGMCWALVNVNSLPLVYDFGDERQIGAYTGLYYFASQSAAILGPVLSGILVDYLGDQYRWLWLFGMAFMFFAWIAIQRIKGKTEPAKALNAS